MEKMKVSYLQKEGISKFSTSPETGKANKSILHLYVHLEVAWLRFLVNSTCPPAISCVPGF